MPRVSSIKDGIIVHWNSSQSSGRIPVDGYTIEFSIVGSDIWHKVTCESKTSNFLFRDLQRGAKYIFRMRAYNIHGVSEPSLESNVVQMEENGMYLQVMLQEIFQSDFFLNNLGPPAPPSDVPRVCVVEEGVMVYWNSSPPTLRKPVVGYVVEHSIVDSHIWHKNFSGTNSSYLVKGLQTSARYHFRIRAYNEYGYSEPSLVSNIVKLDQIGKLIRTTSILMIFTIPKFSGVLFFLR